MRKALDDAFDQPAFDLLLGDYFGKSFDGVSPPGFGKTNEFRIHEVMKQARIEDWLVDLLVAALERRPKNKVIAGLAEELGLTSSGPRLINATGQPLQALINAHSRFVNLELFRTRLVELEAQICWVRIPGGGGTGFLVGPDVVMTNYHVVEPLRTGKALAAQVRCEFDYRRPLDAAPLTTKKMTAVGLADVWLLDKGLYSKADWDPGVHEAAPEETDFALIRLDTAIGGSPVGGDTLDQNASKRGWIDLSATAPALAAGSLLFVLQHPEGEPLQLTVGTVTQFNRTGTRMRHDASSKPGSSGSPVFDAELRIVALHHAHDPAYPPQWNQAIPLGLIQKIVCAKAGVPEMLGVAPCS